ncbi:transmembrane carbonic anhydrase domain protein [Mycobacterium ulcerans str. Harvey]|uniref:Transmembrane carbonic anhydrase domain protein n=1 Tax=Mycobacterium ulcerans str. Harvey TaxID=1299332 RepID=A0ABP3ARQ7_MYCUL|nr:transmembrane carbonic anhydrase domain protein [Mycobacterium ulcerans str. Harvey]
MAAVPGPLVAIVTATVISLVFRFDLTRITLTDRPWMRCSCRPYPMASGALSR